MTDRRFTYLIGAGASAQALPVVSNWGMRMRIQQLLLLGALNLETIKSKKDYEVLPIGEANQNKGSSLGGTLLQELESKDNVKKYCGKLLHFADISDSHASLDTYARKLFLQNTPDSRKELHELKMIISLFLLIEQIVHGVDKRYDAFLAYLFRKSAESIYLPINISIISWNYDLQLELAVSRFLNSTNFNNIQDTLRTVPNLGNQQKKEHTPFLVKLNGTAGLFTSGSREQPSLLETKISLGNTSSVEQDILAVFENFYDYIGNGYKNDKDIPKFERMNVQPYLTFAWENVDVAEHARKTANNILKNTDTLTVIGYSFPLFNRDIDRKIFEGSEFTSIHIQDTDDSISDVVQRFKATGAIQETEIDRLSKHSKVREFFVPPNYKFP